MYMMDEMLQIRVLVNNIFHNATFLFNTILLPLQNDSYELKQTHHGTHKLEA